jgi:uncharacterized protein YggU (UPF0235/DUF167 family)
VYPGERNSKAAAEGGWAMEIKLEKHPEGVVLPVRAHAGARRNELRLAEDGRLRASVTQAPEKGKANKAIIELLSRELGLKRSQIELVAGETAQQKRFLLRDVSAEEVARKLDQLR